MYPNDFKISCAKASHLCRLFCFYFLFLFGHAFCGSLTHALLQSLEDELVRETILQVVSLKLWHTLSFGRLQVIKIVSPN